MSIPANYFELPSLQQMRYFLLLMTEVKWRLPESEPIITTGIQQGAIALVELCRAHGYETSYDGAIASIIAEQQEPTAFVESCQPLIDQLYFRLDQYLENNADEFCNIANVEFFAQDLYQFIQASLFGDHEESDELMKITWNHYAAIIEHMHEEANAAFEADDSCENYLYGL